MQNEQRIYKGALSVERRSGEKAVIVGHAAVFGQLSLNLGGFREKVRTGAFARSLANHLDVRALLNHDPNHVFGRSKNGTLRMQEDEVGLAVEIDPPDTQWARDAVVSIERGDISQMSFGFRTVKDDWFEDPESGAVIRELIDLELFDVSPVTYPAYPQTDVGLRSLARQGLPLESVTRALYRAQYGGLADEDLEIMQRLEAFSRQFATTEPGQAPGSESNGDETRQAPDFAAMRRTLDILSCQ